MATGETCPMLVLELVVVFVVVVVVGVTLRLERTDSRMKKHFTIKIAVAIGA